MIFLGQLVLSAMTLISLMTLFFKPVLAILRGTTLWPRWSILHYSTNACHSTLFAKRENTPHKTQVPLMQSCPKNETSPSNTVRGRQAAITNHWDPWVTVFTTLRRPTRNLVCATQGLKQVQSGGFCSDCPLQWRTKSCTSLWRPCVGRLNFDLPPEKKSRLFSSHAKKIRRAFIWPKAKWSVFGSFDIYSMVQFMVGQMNASKLSFSVRRLKLLHTCNTAERIKARTDGTQVWLPSASTVSALPQWPRRVDTSNNKHSLVWVTTWW